MSPASSPKPAPAAPAPRADWERIESQFRAGSMSTREIAAQHGLSETAIRKRAKRDGWERDLSEKVKAKADALVRKEVVQQVRTEAAVRTKTEPRTETPTDAETVEIEAQVQARIRIAHRRDIGRNRSLVLKLLEELEVQTDCLDDLRQLGVLMESPDDNGVDRLRDLYQKVIALPSRATTMKSLAESLRILVALEREAFHLESAPKADDPLSQLLSGMGRSMLGVVKGAQA